MNDTDPDLQEFEELTEEMLGPRPQPCDLKEAIGVWVNRPTKKENQNE